MITIPSHYVTLTVDGDAPVVVNPRVGHQGILRPTRQDLAVVLGGGREVDGGLGQLPHLLHNLAPVLLHEFGGQPPGDHRVGPRARSLARDDVCCARHQGLAHTADGHVCGREQDVEADLPGHGGRHVVVGGDAGVGGPQVAGAQGPDLEAVLDHVAVGPLVGGVHQLILPPPGHLGTGVTWHGEQSQMCSDNSSAYRSELIWTQSGCGDE